MAGRTPVRVYEYTKEGKYVGKYDSMSDARKKHYPEDLGPRPLFPFEKKGYKFNITYEGNYLFRERCYRDTVKLIDKIYHSPYTTDNIKKDTKAIQVFNLEGVLLLEARNINVLSKLMPHVGKPSIFKQLRSKETRTYNVENYKSGLIFKYKPEELEVSN